MRQNVKNHDKHRNREKRGLFYVLNYSTFKERDYVPCYPLHSILSTVLRMQLRPINVHAVITQSMAKCETYSEAS